MRSLRWAEVHQRRLRRHFLTRPAPTTQLVDVVRAVCGIHAQLPVAAEISLGIRVAGITQREVRAELWERRRLVKTYGPRGTLHFLPADELPLWMAALRAAQALEGLRWYEAPGPPPDAPGLPRATTGPLKQEQGEALLEAIAEALDGRMLTRTELAAEVGRRLGPWARRRLASSWATPPIYQAALTGRLCFGPSRGAQITFVRADQWIGGWREVNEREALVEVFRRYLATYGPARYQDFAAWFNIKPPSARGLLEALAGEVEQVDVEGLRAWVLRKDRGMPRSRSPEPVLRFLPQYDCYIMGVRQRDQIFPEVARRWVVQYSKGRLEGPAGMRWVLLDGVVVGAWQRRQHGQRLEITVALFRRLPASARKQLQAEAQRIGTFLEADSVLHVGP